MFAVLSALLAGCLSVEPTFVTQPDIDRALRTGDLVPVCAGLKQKDEAVRTYAAEKLRDAESSDAACLCDHLVRDGAWDAAVLDGMKGPAKDARIGCAAKLVDDPALADRVGLVNKLLALKSDTVKARLKLAATGDADPAVRAAAVSAYSGSKDAAELAQLAAGLETNPPEWVAAAAPVLAGRPEAQDTLRRLAVESPDGAVRASALAAYRSYDAPDFPELLCRAVNEDADAGVRRAAIAAVRTVRDPKVLACLRTRALTEEADPTVRLVLLQSLAKNAAPDAAAILCDAIPFWVQTYVKDAPVQKESADDVVFYQNERDFEQSYACVERAWKAGRYSRCGKAYLGQYFRELGGKVSFPACGDAPGSGGGGGGGGNEIVF